MPTSTSVHRAVLAALSSAGVDAGFGPLDDMPASGQAAVLWPAAPLHTYSRIVGRRSGRLDRVRVTCVGLTSLDALAVADRVESAIGGMRVSQDGGTLRQVVASDPVPEPNTDPRRVSVSVEYSIVTKGVDYAVEP